MKLLHTSLLMPLLLVILSHIGCAGVGKLSGVGPSKQVPTTEPFVFESQFPVAPGVKLAHKNIRDDEHYYQCELNYQGTASFDSLEAFYSEVLTAKGLRRTNYRRGENSSSFYFEGWPDGKLVSITIFDHSLIPTHPSMQYKQTDHPGMQYRSIIASISKRRS